MSSIKVSSKQILTFACPKCGAKQGNKCELSTGRLRDSPHRNRILEAVDLAKTIALGDAA